MRLSVQLVVGAAVVAASVLSTMPRLSGQSASAPALVITAYNGGAAIPYTTPRTPWGEPDLQGVWSSDDTEGIPRERPKDLGHHALSDRSGVCGPAEARQGRCGAARERRLRHLPQRLRHPRLPADLADRGSAGRQHAGLHAGSPQAAGVARPRHLRRRAVQHLRGLHAVRPLHHPRRRRVGTAGDLRERQPHRAGPGHGRVQRRDDPRHARLLHRRPAAHLPRHPPVPGRRARAVGGRRAGGRHHQLHRQDQHRRQRQRVAPQRPDGDHRALQARGRGRAAVPVHRGRSGHLRAAVHDVHAADAAFGRRDPALRVPRGERRGEERPQRRARRGRGAGSGSRQGHHARPAAGAGRVRAAAGVPPGAAPARSRSAPAGRGAAAAAAKRIDRESA